MELILSILKYIVLGFAGLIGLLIVLAVLFGKRKITKWEFEAEFRNERGREFGEFEIEMSRIEKDEPEFSLKADFKMRHSALALHKTVQVYLDDVLVLEGMVQNAGRVALDNRHLQNEIGNAQLGQICRVDVGGQTLLSEPLAPED